MISYALIRVEIMHLVLCSTAPQTFSKLSPVLVAIVMNTLIIDILANIYCSI